MKKVILLFISMILFSGIYSQVKPSVFQFTVNTIDGKPFKLSDLKGKKVMIVNTASECGLTPQYKDLEELYKKYGGEKFTIVGFPANNFLKQEPGTNVEIKEFCTKNYGVTFPMMEKISVKGKDIHPLYKWLTQKSENGVMDADVKWNFQKYLINENGEFVEMISPKEKPNCEKVINWITGQSSKR